MSNNKYFDKSLGRSRKGTYRVTIIVSGNPQKIKQADFLIAQYDETYGKIEKFIKIEKNWLEDNEKVEEK